MKTMDFNLNDYVLVKINDLGYQKLADDKNELMSDFPNYESVTAQYFKDKADENGYTCFQAWDFINKFGSETKMELHPMFDINIKIQVK